MVALVPHFPIKKIRKIAVTNSGTLTATQTTPATPKTGKCFNSYAVHVSLTITGASQSN